MTSEESNRFEQSALRSTLLFATIAVFIPLCLHALFERQARRLEALGDHGTAVIATVTGVSGDRTVFYEYVVDGQHYDWNVGPDAGAPTSVGATFEAHFLPEDPAFSRPGADRSIATREAASNRSGASKGLLGIFWFFGAFAVVSAIELRQMRRLGVEAYRTGQGRAAGMRRRLAAMGVIIVPILLAITYWHMGDAEDHGESPLVPVVGLLLAVGVLGGTVAYALREGPDRASARAGRLTRWIAPIAIGIAVLRLLALLLETNIG